MKKFIVAALISPIFIQANDAIHIEEVQLRPREPAIIEMPNTSRDRVFVSGGFLYMTAQEELKFHRFNYTPGFRVSIGSDALPDDSELRLTLSHYEPKNTLQAHTSLSIETLEATFGKRYQFTDSFAIKSFWGVEGVRVNTHIKRQKLGPQLGIDIRQNIWKNLDLLTVASASAFGSSKSRTKHLPITLVNKLKLNLDWGTPKQTDGLLFHISTGYEFQYWLNDTSYFIPYMTRNFLLHGFNFQARLDF